MTRRERERIVWLAIAVAGTGQQLAGGAPTLMPRQGGGLLRQAAARWAAGCRTIAASGARRTGPGQVEVHDKETDIFYIVDGEATFVTGGKMIGGKLTQARTSGSAPTSRAARRIS